MTRPRRFRSHVRLLAGALGAVTLAFLIPVAPLRGVLGLAAAVCLLIEVIRVIRFFAVPLSVAVGVAGLAGAVTIPPAQIAFRHLWWWALPLELVVLGCRPRARRWAAFHGYHVLAIIALQHVAFMRLGLVIFSNLGPAQKCEEQPQVHPVVSACQLHAAGHGDRRSDHSVWVPWLRVVTNGQLPEDANVEPRISKCDSSGVCTYLYSTYGWSDGGISAAVKMDHDGNVVKTYLGASMFDVMCLEGTGRCVVSSPMEATLRLIDDEHDGLLGGLRFVDEDGLGYGPSYLFRVKSPDEVGMVLLGGDHPVDPPAGTSFRTIAPECPAGKRCQVLVVYNVVTQQYRSRVVVNPPMSLMGRELYFAGYDTDADQLFMGANLVDAAVERDIAPKWTWLGLELTVLSWNVATDMQVNRLTGDRIFSFPFKGIGGSIEVFDAKMRHQRSISVEQGVRPIRYDPKEHVVVMGGYYSGQLSTMSIDSGETLDSWDLGTRIRSIEFLPDGERVLVTSGSGTFIVNYTPGAR